jgi:polycystin 2
LKARGYTDAEIETVFSRYDADGDRVLDDAERRRFRADLAAQENNLDMDIKDLNESQAARYARTFFSISRKHASSRIASRKASIKPPMGAPGTEVDNSNRVTYDEFAILVRRIDRMEYSIGNIVSRVRLDRFLSLANRAIRCRSTVF